MPLALTDWDWVDGVETLAAVAVLFLVLSVVGVLRWSVARDVRQFFQRFSHIVVLGLVVITVVWSAVAVANEETRSGGGEHDLSHYLHEGVRRLFLAEKVSGEYWQDELARSLALLTTVVLVLDVIESRFRGVLDEVRLLAWRRQHIVFGLDPLGVRLACDLAQPHKKDGRRTSRGRQVVAVDSHVPAAVRERLIATGAVVLRRSPETTDTLHEVRVGRAKRIFLMGPCDADNLELAANIIRFCETEKRACPPLRVRLSDETLLDRRGVEKLDIEAIDPRKAAVDELLAQVLTGQRLHRPVHFVLWGFGTVGQAVARRIAMQAHTASRHRPRLTVFFDPADRSSVERFLERFPRFAPDDAVRSAGGDPASWAPPAAASDWSDQSRRPKAAYRAASADAVEYACNAVFVPRPGDIADPHVLDWLKSRVADSDLETVLIICGHGDETNPIDANLRRTHRLAMQSATRKLTLPTWVYLAEHMQSGGLFLPEHVRPFGESISMLVPRRFITADEDTVSAHVRHVIYQRADRGRTDVGRQAFRDLAEMYNQSNREAGLFAGTLLRSIGFGSDHDAPLSRELPPETIELGAEIEHNRWMGERLVSGGFWAAERTDDSPGRPQMVPYDLLPETEKDKDRTSMQQTYDTLYKAIIERQQQPRPWYRSWFPSRSS